MAVARPTVISMPSRPPARSTARQYVVSVFGALNGSSCALRQRATHQACPGELSPLRSPGLRPCSRATSFVATPREHTPDQHPNRKGKVALPPCHHHPGQEHSSRRKRTLPAPARRELQRMLDAWQPRPPSSSPGPYDGQALPFKPCVCDSSRKRNHVRQAYAANPMELFPYPPRAWSRRSMTPSISPWWATRESSSWPRIWPQPSARGQHQQGTSSVPLSMRACYRLAASWCRCRTPATWHDVAVSQSGTIPHNALDASWAVTGWEATTWRGPKTHRLLPAPRR